MSSPRRRTQSASRRATMRRRRSRTRPARRPDGRCCRPRPSPTACRLAGTRATSQRGTTPGADRAQRCRRWLTRSVPSALTVKMSRDRPGSTRRRSARRLATTAARRPRTSTPRRCAARCRPRSRPRHRRRPQREARDARRRGHARTADRVLDVVVSPPAARRRRPIRVRAELVPGRGVREAVAAVVQAAARVVDTLDERRIGDGARGQHHGRDGEQETGWVHGALGRRSGEGVAKSKRRRSQFNVA